MFPGKEDNVFFEIVPTYTGEKLFLKKKLFLNICREGIISGRYKHL